MPRLDQLLEVLLSARALVVVLWSGLAVLTVALVLLARTRWGQSRPLGKCLALSVLAHLLLLGYATTVEIVSGAVIFDEPVLHVSLVEPAQPDRSPSEESPADEAPWQRFPDEPVAPPEKADPERERPDEPPEPERQIRAEVRELPDRPPLDHLAMADVRPPEPRMDHLEPAPSRGSPGREEAEPIEVPAAERREAALPSVPGLESPAPSAVAGEVAVLGPPGRLARVHTALSEPFGPLPQWTEAPAVPDPADALPGANERLARPSPSVAPEAFPRHVQDSAYAAGQPPGGETVAGGGAGRLHQPSVGAVAGRYHGGGVETSLPPAGPEAAGPARLPQASRPPGAAADIPDIYRLRVAPDRSQRAQQRGATPETEAAVQAALKWLAENQASDGRWDASDHGGGRETLVHGRNRHGAGAEADTGMTGLSLLAFLAAGNTHLEGPYKENVRRGLEYLMRIQATDGNLAGRASFYARMYCHAMAAFALSEAYAMTGDQRLREPVGRAVAYIIAAQSPQTGGWRYTPRDPGDTSQLGWQWMALKSAELAGTRVPQETKEGIVKYLRTVSAGREGGLASYRPGERVSPAMTAEAMVCWQFLGLPRSHPACDEAGDYLVANLPGQGETNFYYWYYGTLSMYQLQGEHWRRWNDAMTRTLLASQRKSGPTAGSWDPNCVWGSYGGRVYTTALGTLCLEVYYRYLPLFVEASPIERAP